MTWLNGNKTYLGMIGLGIIGILTSQGILDAKVAGTLASILTAWTGIAYRHAMKKGGK
jgi:hypothetical protein